MKKYEIQSPQDFAEMVKSFFKYFMKREDEGKKFQALTIIAKRYRKSRTPKQLRTYWRSIHEMKKGFLALGYQIESEDLHSFVKRESGFTKIVRLGNGKTVMIEKSIADDSEDVNIENINFLIQFIIEFAKINLNYEIKILDATNTSS